MAPSFRNSQVLGVRSADTLRNSSFFARFAVPLAFGGLFGLALPAALGACGLSATEAALDADPNGTGAYGATGAGSTGTGEGDASIDIAPDGERDGGASSPR